MLILHGDHTAASRQFFLTELESARSRRLNLVELSGQTLTLPDLEASASATTLLGETNFLVTTDLFARRPGKEKSLLVSYLKSHPGLQLIDWESKDVSAQLTTFPASAVRKFELPKYLFKFLDRFSLDLLHQTLQVTPAELLFSLLARRLHDLILAKAGLLSGPAWKTDLLRRQAAAYSPSRLQSLSRDLLLIDYAQKTSASAMDLSAALELWVIKALI